MWLLIFAGLLATSVGKETTESNAAKKSVDDVVLLEIDVKEPAKRSPVAASGVYGASQNQFIIRHGDDAQEISPEYLALVDQYGNPQQQQYVSLPRTGPPPRRTQPGYARQQQLQQAYQNQRVPAIVPPRPRPTLHPQAEAQAEAQAEYQAQIDAQQRAEAQARLRGSGTSPAGYQLPAGYQDAKLGTFEQELLQLVTANQAQEFKAQQSHDLRQQRPQQQQQQQQQHNNYQDQIMAQINYQNHLSNMSGGNGLPQTVSVAAAAAAIELMSNIENGASPAMSPNTSVQIQQDINQMKLEDRKQPKPIGNERQYKLNYNPSGMVPSGDAEPMNWTLPNTDKLVNSWNTPPPQLTTMDRHQIFRTNPPYNRVPNMEPDLHHGIDTTYMGHIDNQQGFPNGNTAALAMIPGLTIMPGQYGNPPTLSDMPPPNDNNKIDGPGWGLPDPTVHDKKHPLWNTGPNKWH